MDTFCDVSGQQVSLSKSRVFCSKNVRVRDARDIVRACGSPLTDNLGKYLGLPLLHDRVNKNTFREILEKVQRRLTSWKSSTLSLAGRITLIKAVTSAISVYAMQSAKLPNDLCYKLDRVNRKFLWGHNAERRTVHLVNWATVFWSQLLRDKYLNRFPLLKTVEHSTSACSHIWKGIKFGAKLISKGISWRVGNGSDILFWTDNWIHNFGPLVNFSKIPLNESLLLDKVKMYVKNANWDIDKLSGVLP
ncbi:hypothetical protein ACOSQ4_023746 [Xanthoceras sorbifolium]